MTSEPVELLIVNAHVLTVDAQDTVIANGAVAVAKGRIAAVGRSAELAGRYRAAAVIDAAGGVLHPGFIDAHVHVSQYTARSVLARLDQAGLTMGGWKAELRPEDEHASASLAAIDYLASGYTGFVDPGTVFEPDAVARVAEEIGIRIWLTDPYVADLGPALAANNPELVSPTFLARWPKDLDEAAARIGRELRRNADPMALARGFIGLYGEGTASAALRAHAARAAQDAGVQYQEHLGYNPAAYRAETAALGRTPLAQFAESHGLHEGVTLTHMNLLDDEDADRIAEAGPRLIWCPYGTLQAVGTGKARNRMVELAGRGVKVACATDIPRVIDFDALGGLTAACAAATGQPVAPAALLRMRTIDAAASVGSDGLTGSIEPGKSADLVLRMPAEEVLGVDPLWETAMLGGGGVRVSLVAGRTVYREGRYERTEARRIRAAAHRSARALLSRTGLA